MLTQSHIARAAFDADAVVEEHGLPFWCERHEVDLEGLAYVAEQRALRMCLMMDGVRVNPNTRSYDNFTLSRMSRQMSSLFAAMWLDGFAAGHIATTED